MPYNVAQVARVAQPDLRFGAEGPSPSAEMTLGFDDAPAMPRGCDRLG